MQQREHIMRYSKPSLSIESQIQLLQSRGLLINDTTRATRHLSNISYYRLSAYMKPYQVRDDSGKIIDKFEDGSNWDQIINLYRFDRKFRLLVFDAIERIEISLRTQLIHQLSQKYGSHWHTDNSLFKTITYQNKETGEIQQREIFNDLNSHIREQLKSNKSMEFIKHYQKKYNEPDTPPSWMSVEILYFNQLSLICKSLKNPKDLSDLSGYFSLPKDIFISWIHTVNYLRNICAHHSRLWNLTLQVTPSKLQFSKRLNWITAPEKAQSAKMYYSLCVIIYFLQTINPNSKFVKHFKDLCGEFPDVNIGYMGFPDNWMKEKIWQ